MSLVNDMLKDLESRKAGESAVVINAGIRPAAKRSKSLLPLLAVLVVFVLAAAIWLFWPVSPEFQETSVAQAPVIAPPPIITKPAVSQPAENQNAEQSNAQPEPVSMPVKPQYHVSWQEPAAGELTLAITSAAPLKQTRLVPGQGNTDAAILVESGVWNGEFNHRHTLLEQVVMNRSGDRDQLNIRFSSKVKMSSQIEANEKGERLVLTFIIDQPEQPVTSIAAKKETDTVGDKLTIRRQPKVTVKQLMNDVRDHMDAGQYQRAASKLLKVIDESPQHQMAHYLLAQTYSQLDQVEEAKVVLARLLGMAPANSDASALMARLLLTTGDSDSATNVLSAAITQNPAHVESLALLGALYQEQTRYDKAANIYTKLVAAEPNIGQWWLGLGIALDQLLKSKDALLAYKRALALGGIDAAAGQYAQQRIKELE